MNRVYTPNTSPTGGWVVRLMRQGPGNIGSVYHKAFNRMHDSAFNARYLAILVNYHLGIGLNEVEVMGKGIQN